MKKILFTLVLLLTATSGYAQNDYKAFLEQRRKNYKEFSDDRKKQMEEFRDRYNNEFSRRLREKWIEKDTSPADTLMKEPKPVEPPVFNPDIDIKPDRDTIIIDEIIVVPSIMPKVEPLCIVPEKPTVKPSYTFTFYGTKCDVYLTSAHNFTIRNLNEAGIADAWEKLATDKYYSTVESFLALKSDLHLGDWGYLQMVQKATEEFFSTKNNAVLLQMFIMTQSGYKVRIAKTDNSLALLAPSDVLISGLKYFTIDGNQYYILDKSLENGSFTILPNDYPVGKFVSAYMYEEPLFAQQLAGRHTFKSERYPSVQSSVNVNKRLIDFYNAYPKTSSWNLYSKASLSKNVKESLYPVLRKSIEGKSESEAANILINFVQTAFKYKTDDEQFGYEKPFFGDELFYYPYCDCEDRSILYSILVRDLMGLDVVFLHYPNHLATAVRFTANVNGDYFTIGNDKYYVCDPTYIGSDIGNTMPEFANAKARVIKIE